jgi:hypothetical protein
VPEQAHGFLFEYELVKIARGTATIRYTDRIIKPQGINFEVYKETEEPQLMPYRLSDIDDSHEKWQQANGRVNVALYHHKQALIKASGTTVVEINDDNFDMSDIDEVFAAHGRGSHMLEHEFCPSEEPVWYITVDGQNRQKQVWKHKMTGQTFWRFQNKSGKSYETGRCTKFLDSMKSGRHPLAYARAKRILSLNGNLKYQVNEDEDTEVVPLDRETILSQQVRGDKRLFFCHFTNFF